MSHDYSSDSSESYNEHESYIKRRDDQNLQSTENPLQDETSGTLFSLKLEPTAYEEYEMWAFVEDVMRVSLVDLSCFRNLDGSMNGLVVGQFEEPVTVSRLKRLHGRLFNNKPIEARLFQTFGSFQKYCQSIAELRIHESSLNIDSKTTPPQVYVMNFPDNNEQSVKQFFHRCGPITLAKPYKYKDGVFFTLFFNNEASAKLACRTFDGFVHKGQTLRVAPLYKNAAERSFIAHHVQNPEWFRNEVSCFGKIESSKVIPENKQDDDKNRRYDVFILMDKIEDAKAACVLLNKLFDNGVEIKTNFIDYQYYTIGDNHY